jgi:hypothetical protein
VAKRERRRRHSAKPGEVRRRRTSRTRRCAWPSGSRT